MFRRSELLPFYTFLIQITKLCHDAEHNIYANSTDYNYFKHEKLYIVGYNDM
jgi:hypothetical protein